MDNKTPPQSPQAPAEEKETASCPLCGDEFPDRWVKVLVQCTKPRTPQDMDGTLTLIFAKLETNWNITTKISAFLQLRKKWILTKFEGCGSKNGPATPIWSFRHFWQEIQIQGTKSLQIWYKAGTYWGLQLVKIWCWYLKPLLRNSKFKIFCLPSVPHYVKK